MMGKIVPPTLDPLAKHARASPNLFLNQCVMTPAPIVKMAPLAIYPMAGISVRVSQDITVAVGRRGPGGLVYLPRCRSLDRG